MHWSATCLATSIGKISTNDHPLEKSVLKARQGLPFLLLRKVISLPNCKDQPLSQESLRNKINSGIIFKFFFKKGEGKEIGGKEGKEKRGKEGGRRREGGQVGRRESEGRVGGRGEKREGGRDGER